MHIINMVLLVGNILLLVGLGLASAGGGYLAYDALHGAGARFQAQVAAARLASFKSTREGVREIYRNLQGSYTEEEKQALLDDEEKENGPQEANLAKAAGSIEDIYSDRVEMFALRGVYLLIAGFVVQFAGTVMVALESDVVHL